MSRWERWRWEVERERAQEKGHDHRRPQRRRRWREHLNTNSILYQLDTTTGKRVLSRTEGFGIFLRSPWGKTTRRRAVL